MLGHARGDGQHVGVEDDVLRGEADLFGEKPVGAFADGDLALVGVGLARLVECHDHRGGSQPTHALGMLEEGLFALL